MCVCVHICNTGCTVVRTFCVLRSVMSRGFSIVRVSYLYMQHFAVVCVERLLPCSGVCCRCVEGVCVLQCN